MTYRLDHPDLGPVEISPMHPGELALVLDGWMRSSHWRRRAMLAVVEAGGVLVARDEHGVALGWVALEGDRVAHAVVKYGYRGNGLARALWHAAGRPCKLADDVTKRCRQVMQHLTQEKA